MALTEKELAQARENSTNAVSVYSPAASTTAVIKQVYVCNQSGADAVVRIFVDYDGTTYDESTALFWDITIPANYTLDLKTHIVMANENGNLAYRTNTANALTITLYGAEIT